MRDGALRLGEVVARVRHDLRRGAAPVRRVALRVRAAVPADDGEARRRLDRRPVAGDLDRPEDDVAEPALDGGHGHGDLRLPAPALRAHRPSALPGLRAPDRRPVARSDRRAGPAPRGGDEVHRQRSGRARPQGRVQGCPRRAAPRRVHSREGRRRAATARGGVRARQEVQAHDRGRRRPADHEVGPAPAPDAVDRDSDLARGGPHRDRRAGLGRDARWLECPRRFEHDVLRESRLPGSRRVARRARAARLLVQLASWRLPALHRARRAARDRPRPARPGHLADDRGGRARPLDDREPELLRLGHRGDRGALRNPARCAMARADDRAAGPLPARDRRRAHLRHLPEPDGAQAPVHDGLRGPRRQPAAALSRDRLVAGARPHRGVHELPPVSRSVTERGSSPRCSR